ncbi:hypothetical protein GF360_00675 [candidate division WWE3 bacterium]|nr:hypothetical protein [candidate division WWE3 bacterium]
MSLLKLLPASVVYAQNPADLNSVGTVVEIVDVLARAFNVLVFSAGAVFIVMVIFSAYKFATAQGDPKGTAGAKQSLTFSVIGLLIVIGVFVINVIVNGILGTNAGDAGGVFGSLRQGISELVEWTGNTPSE